MATQKTVAQLNAIWITGYTPTQSDFQNLFASYPNILDNGFLDGIDAAVTAHAGGGQGSAYQITKRVTVIATVATIADSVKLPVGAVGAQSIFFNKAANAVAVYPSTGQYISKFGINAFFLLPQNCWCVATFIDGSGWTLQTYQAFASASNPVLFLGVGATTTMQVNQNNNFVLDGLNTNTTIAAPTGLVGDGQRISLMIRDTGTARTLTWNAAFKGTFAPLPPKTIASTWWYGTFQWSETDGLWLCLSSIYGAINNVARASYIAQIFASGTGAPTVTVFENTIGGDPVWTHTATGIVTMTLTNMLGTVGYSLAATCDVNGTANYIESDSSDAPDAIHFSMKTDAGALNNSGVWTLILYVYNS